MVFEHPQGRGLHFPGQPVPMSDCSLSEEIFPNIQSKAPLMQLEAIEGAGLVQPEEEKAARGPNICL